MVDPAATAFFRAQQDIDIANRRCFDCNTDDAQWASVSHGIYISIGASGVHRSLGVKTSFVLSTTMDSWKPLHLRMMELGGNQRFKDFLQEHGVPEDMPLRQKYLTRAAEWYRRNLKAEAERTALPEPLPSGTGHLPINGVGSTAEQALLDQVFSSAPSEGMSVGGVPVSCSSLQLPMRSKSLGRVGSPQREALQVKKLKTGAFVDNVCSADREGTESFREPDSPSIFTFAKELSRTLEGHCTARRLKAMSSGSMGGFGSGACTAAAVAA